MKVNLDKKDWTLLIIAQASPLGLTPVKLQKSLFLLQKAFPAYTKEFYSFIPYNYGPFDVAIYHDVNILINEGYIEKITTQPWEKYHATKKGEAMAVPLRNNLPNNFISYMRDLIDWILPLSFQKLITSIYKEYPEYKVNSVFKE